jgi:hypothetical protein
MRAFSSSMARVRFALVALLVVSAACAGASSSPSPTQTTPSSSAWTELRVSWDFGPCPADGRSCHQTLIVKPDGGFIATETPNPPNGASAEPIKRFAALDPQEIRELHRIVDVPAFVDKVGSFGCPPEYDATIRIELEGPWGVRHDDVGGCVHSSDAAPNAPRALVQLLERHRFASKDAPPTRASQPTGVGDPCNTGVGCAKGLVCVVAPCVVAPCVSGSCQASSP